MVFSQLEQKYLMKMLIAERTDQPLKIARTTYFIRTMAILAENDCIIIINNKRKVFKLTEFGRMMASYNLKHSKTDEKLRKYAYTYEWFRW